MYSSPVDKQYRSRMNVPFRIKIANSFDEKLEKKFLTEAEKLHMRELNGHRSVGGIRASIFNAISLEEVQMLVEFMRKYATEHKNDLQHLHIQSKVHVNHNNETTKPTALHANHVNGTEHRAH